MGSLKPSLDELRKDAERTRRKLSRLASQLHALERHVDCLGALRREEQHYVARLEVLERTLDVRRVNRHVRAAVICPNPILHVWIADLLPPDIYEAMLNAVPDRVFLDDRPRGRHDLPVPPRIGPTDAIVTWQFVTEVVRPLSEPLLARFRTFLATDAAIRFPALPPFAEWGVDITVSDDRIVRRGPGHGRATHERPWALLNGILNLARPDDSEEFGSRLGPKVFPFRPNSALVFAGSAEACDYVPIPPDAATDLARYSYEFDIGPTRDGRRRLAPAQQGR